MKALGRAALALTIALSVAHPAPAEDIIQVPAPSPVPSPSSTPTLDLEGGASQESLTNGRQGWYTQYLRVTQRDDNRVFYAEADATTRFGQYDSQYTIGGYVPLGGPWTAVVQGAFSPTHRVLPSGAVTVGLQYASGDRWFETLSGGSTTYTANSVDTVKLITEHYWGPYRAAYTITVAHLAFTGTDVEHALELDRYYGTRQSSVGISYLTGREVDNVGLPSLVSSYVQGWNLIGRHWFGDRWGLVYGAVHLNQGTFYSQTGGNLGLDYRF